MGIGQGDQMTGGTTTTADGDAPVRPPVAALTATGILTILLAGLELLATPLLLAYSVMCQDDFDTSDCGAAQAQALIPLVFAVVAIVLWSVGVVRRRRPGAVAWAVGGFSVAALPILLLWLGSLG